MVADLEIGAVGSDQERASVRNLLRSEFEVSPGVGQAFADLYDHLLDHDPLSTQECSRIAKIGGTVVGHAFLASRSLRICEGDCPAGLVGLVVVDPDHRGQGIATALIEDVHDRAASLGMGLIVLAGDSAFYRRFGYHQAYVITQATVEVGEGVRSLRTAIPDDVKPLTQLSRQVTPPGSVSGLEDRLAWLLATDHPAGLLRANPVILGEQIDTCETLVAEDRSGFARVAFGRETAWVYEAATADKGAADGLLSGLMHACGEQKIPRLGFRLPRLHPLIAAAGAEPLTTDDPEFQFRVIDPDVLLSAAAPGLEQRMQAACPDWRGGLLVSTESDHIQITRQDGRLRIARVKGDRVEAPSGSIQMPMWGVGRTLLGQDDLVRATARSGGDTDLDAVFAALCGPGRPSFCLSDAI